MVLWDSHTGYPLGFSCSQLQSARSQSNAYTCSIGAAHEELLCTVHLCTGLPTTHQCAGRRSRQPPEPSNCCSHDVSRPTEQETAAQEAIAEHEAPEQAAAHPGQVKGCAATLACCVRLRFVHEQYCTEMSVALTTYWQWSHPSRPMPAQMLIQKSAHVLTCMICVAMVSRAACSDHLDTCRCAEIPMCHAAVMLMHCWNSLWIRAAQHFRTQTQLLCLRLAGVAFSLMY